MPASQTITAAGGGFYIKQHTVFNNVLTHKYLFDILDAEYSKFLSFERVVQLGKPDLYDKAHQKVKEVLASPPKNLFQMMFSVKSRLLPEKPKRS